MKPGVTLAYLARATAVSPRTWRIWRIFCPRFMDSPCPLSLCRAREGDEERGRKNQRSSLPHSPPLSRGEGATGPSLSCRQRFLDHVLEAPPEADFRMRREVLAPTLRGRRIGLPRRDDPARVTHSQVR